MRFRSGLLDRAKASAIRALGRKPSPEAALHLESRKTGKGWRWVVLDVSSTIVAESRRYFDDERQAERAYAQCLIHAPHQRTQP